MLAKNPSCARLAQSQPAVAFFSAARPVSTPGAGAGACCHPAPAQLRGTQHPCQNWQEALQQRQQTQPGHPRGQWDEGAGPEPGQSTGLAAVAGSRRGGGGSGCSLPGWTASYFSFPAAAAASQPWLLLLQVGGAPPQPGVSCREQLHQSRGGSTPDSAEAKLKPHGQVRHGKR